MRNHPFDLYASLEAQATRQNAEGCVKVTEDLDRYRELIASFNPDLIIECGTFSGKSAAWFLQNSQAEVITIDQEPQVDHGTLARWDHEGRSVSLLEGSTLSPNIIRTCHLAAEWSAAVLVVLDSDHSAIHVWREIERYAWLPNVRALVVEDTIVRYMHQLDGYTGSPMDAAEYLVNHYPTCWGQDAELEGLFPVTQNPKGWLRRKPTPI